MAHVAYLSDGTTTVNFLNECGTSGWCHIEEGGLRIKFPPKKQVWTGGNVWKQGRVLTQHNYDNREIDLVFEIGASSWDGILDTERTINRLLEQARLHQLTGQVMPVYLQVQLDTTTSYVRFDVLDGDLVIPDDIMSLEKLTWRKCTSNHYVLKGCELTLVCKPFARGVETKIVDAVNIYDSLVSPTYLNYVTWAGSVVKGDVPGPLRIDHTNTYNHTTRMRRYWTGLRDVGTVASWPGVLEAEDADISGGVIITGSQYSGGEAVNITLAGPGYEYIPLTWNIAYTAAPENYLGKVRVIAIGQLKSSIRYNIRMKYSVATIHDYPEYRPTAALVNYLDLGAIELMPWPVNPELDAGSYSIALVAQNDETGTETIIDALYLIPADDYKYRRWSWQGFDAAYGAMIEDDGRRDLVANKVSTYLYFLLNYEGLPIHATPGKDGRLCFFWTSSTGAYHPTNYTATISVWHTPYYLDVRGSA